MKVEIYCDEMYPFYGVSHPTDPDRATVEIGNELLAEYRRIMREFEGMQEVLKNLGGYK